MDRLLGALDQALRTLFAAPRSTRACPVVPSEATHLGAHERRHAAALMRVNHVGEICAQALYTAQAMATSNDALRTQLEQAAREETDHLAWTKSRLDELGSRPSLLNPLWYAGSYVIGAAAGLAGDRWNLGFLAETERQVVAHLDSHMKRLSHQDAKSRAILVAMKRDEAKHATTALHMGGSELPLACRLMMRAASRVMTTTAYWV